MVFCIGEGEVWVFLLWQMSFVFAEVYFVFCIWEGVVGIWEGVFDILRRRILHLVFGYMNQG